MFGWEVGARSQEHHRALQGAAAGQGGQVWGSCKVQRTFLSCTMKMKRQDNRAGPSRAMRPGLSGPASVTTACLEIGFWVGEHGPQAVSVGGVGGVWDDWLHCKLLPVAVCGSSSTGAVPPGRVGGQVAAARAVV